MEQSKLQIGCMLICLYILFNYLREKKAYEVKKKEPIFEGLLVVGIAGIFFDGLTAYTVNHLETVPHILNSILHLLFLCSLDILVFLMFIYIVDISYGIPVDRKKQLLLVSTLLVNIGIVVMFIPELRYCHGATTNYSMGVSAYTCFAMTTVYMLAAICILLIGWRKLGWHKVITIATCIIVAIGVMVYQMFHPQALISCMGPTMVIVGSYLNMENPLFTKLKKHNEQMVMGFATLVENRDGSTGGHIKRTTKYAEMLANELKSRGIYKEILTRDYVNNLVMAAPMHDIGKIAIPDAILQKPGKLTDEEYDIMKTHAQRGGRIIQETFENREGDPYRNIAYEVARNHHEKWNGKGYPDGMKGKEIPLCARIMSVVDVFDAVSAKRCYRDAMPLEKCFSIIEEGVGKDFDPFIATVFLEMREEITEVYEAWKDGEPDIVSE